MVCGLLVSAPGAGRADRGKASSARQEASEARFSGQITAISFACERDANCFVVVDGHKSVDFGHDTRGEPASEHGSCDDLWSLQRARDRGIGRTVEVFAASYGGDAYSIYGKTTYFIRVVAKPHGAATTK